MWNANDFCEADQGFEYIFSMMQGIYGGRFSAHWQGVDPQVVRQVWKDQLGRFLTYRPSMDYAIGRLKGEHPPSAITFREYCNSGPLIPDKPHSMIEKQKSQYEVAQAEIKKQEALAKLDELKKSIKSNIAARQGEDE
jgi:hypothetical protein